MSRLLSEILLVARFATTGTVATAAHFAVAFVAYGGLRVTEVAANALGFGTAVLVSFFGHYYFSFKSLDRPDVVRALGRFVVVASVAFAASNALLLGLVRLGFDWMAMIGAGLLIPAINYLAGRLWAFNRRNVNGPRYAD